ncbi:SDR family oxidoreductase [Aureimonas populi]|uniref:SDR family oxidoreductase n=1 Tax=Aureimonas populi TaxID=1701758 RepID=A0ABW5CK70_9HYPH|nr:SDR family oxidoreductase [Aureimonas populi]
MPQTILITGASSGIGKSTARLFAERGWNVVATMRTPEKEVELRAFDNVLVTRLDVTDGASIRSAVEAALSRFGRVDALLNNAGYAVWGPLEAVSADAIRKQYDTNVIGVMETTKALLSHFRDNRAGMILNVSSIGGILTFPLGTMYHSTKFAIEGFSEALSFEMREIGVTVKIIEPGDTLTDFKVDFAADDAMPEYQPVIEKFAEGYKPIKAAGSEPIVIAEVIFKAATDGTDQLRYPAGEDSVAKVAKRKAEDEATFLADIRRQFAIA